MSAVYIQGIGFDPEGAIVQEEFEVEGITTPEVVREMASAAEETAAEEDF